MKERKIRKSLEWLNTLMIDAEEEPCYRPYTFFEPVVKNSQSLIGNLERLFAMGWRPFEDTGGE